MAQVEYQGQARIIRILERKPLIVYKGILLKKSSNRKSKLALSTLITKAFKHRISFAPDLAANFGCDQFRIMPDIVSKLLRAAI